MTHAPQPHDLLWLNAAADLLDVEEAWVTTQWHPGLPVVVRRDVNDEGDIPVGVRGMKRDQRAAGWVRPAAVARAVTPEALADRQRLLHLSLIHI